MMRDETIAFVAGYDFVALKKISIIGKPVGVFKAAATSPMLNRMAILIPKQRIPLTTILQTMVLGTTTAAFFTSSAASWY
jgi:hypothetical protein